MTEAEIYTAVKSWIEYVANSKDYEGATAWKANVAKPRHTATQSGSECPVPKTGLYATMDILSDDIIQECGPRILPCGECFAEEQCCLHEVTIDIQVYRCGAFDFIRCLRASLKLSTMRKACFPEMSVRDIGVITPISQFLKGSREERASMSVTLGYVTTEVSPVECLILDCDPCDPCNDFIETPEIEEC